MRFEGIIPALLTPFADDDRVDVDALWALVDRLIEQGVDGLFVCGSSGEWWLMTEAERRQVMEAAVAAVAGRVPVMVHVGAPATAMAQRLARHAEEIGADAISALPPTGAAYSAEVVWRYFAAVGESCGLPLYLYHLPNVQAGAITVDRFVDGLVEIPTLAGVKFSAYRVDDLITLRLRAGDRLNILGGGAEQLLSTTVNGAEGSICTWYNLVPRLGRRIVDAVDDGDVVAARAHQDLLVQFGNLLRFNVFGCAKWLIARRGIDVGRPRAPNAWPTERELDGLWMAVEDSGMLDWSL